MRGRRAARVTTGVAVGAVALTSVFAGTAWAPKITTGPAPEVTRQHCLFTPGWRDISGEYSFDNLPDCLRIANALMKAARK